MDEQETDRTSPAVPRGQRQRRWSGGERPFKHKVALTPDQQEQVVFKAAIRGITIPNLLVQSALAGGAEAAAQHAAFRDELLRITRLMGKVSNNINQLARVANATHQLEPETAATLEAHVCVLERLESFIDALGRDAA